MLRLIFGLLLCSITAWAIPPVIYYTDLTSGPNTGGENNNGTILTICGRNFGATRGSSTVTIGGGAVAAYKIWGNNNNGPCGAGHSQPVLDSIVVNIGALAATGQVVVTVGGVSSVNAPRYDGIFTVRSGNIYCASNNVAYPSVPGTAPTPSNANDGKFPNDGTTGGTHGCWADERFGQKHLNLGDILYLGAGPGDNFQSFLTPDTCSVGQDFIFVIWNKLVAGVNCSVQSSNIATPIAFGGYPGNTTTIGDGSTVGGIQVGMIGYGEYSAGYWTFFNMKILGGQDATGHGSQAIFGNMGGGMRAVNLDMQCAHCGTSVATGGHPMTINETWVPPGYPPAHIPPVVAVKNGPPVAWFFGNYFHNFTIKTPYVNENRASSGVYLGVNGNGIEMGWNEINGADAQFPGLNRDGLHIHSSAINNGIGGDGTLGYPQWGLWIHDNYIQGTGGANDMNMVDPASGPVEFYNNIFANQGNCLTIGNPVNTTGTAIPFASLPSAAANTSVGYWINNASNSVSCNGSGATLSKCVSNGVSWLWNPNSPLNSNGYYYADIIDAQYTPLSGTIKFYNNTYYNIGACQFPGQGSGGATQQYGALDGWGNQVPTPRGTNGTTMDYNHLLWQAPGLQTCGAGPFVYVIGGVVTTMPVSCATAGNHQGTIGSPLTLPNPDPTPWNMHSTCSVLRGTSTSSLTIGTGTKTLTTQTNLSYIPGSPIAIMDSITNPINSMSGTVTSYSGTTLVANITSTTGSGTLASWKLFTHTLSSSTGASIACDAYRPYTMSFAIQKGATVLEAISDDGAGNLRSISQPSGVDNGIVGAITIPNPALGPAEATYYFTPVTTLTSAHRIYFYSVPGVTIEWKNNLVYLTKGANVFAFTGGNQTVSLWQNHITSANNMFYMLGATPGVLPQLATGLVGGGTTDPKFVNAPGADWHLQSSSIAIAAGVTTAATVDFDGVVRTVPFTLGALQGAASSTCLISTTTCPTANTGVPYSCTVLTSGCASPSFSVASGLPVWASIGVSSGIISGTPSGGTPTTSNFTVAVSDANGNPSQPLSILDCTPPAITNNPPITAGTVGVNYGPYTFTGTGDTPITWTSTGNPPGLTLNSGSGVLSGTPTLAGSYTIVVTATNACSVVNKSFPNTIIAPSTGGPGGTVTVGGTVSIGTTVTK